MIFHIFRTFWVQTFLNASQLPQLAPAATASGDPTMAPQELDIDLPVSDDELQSMPNHVEDVDADVGSVSDSPTLECVACKVSSKGKCPIAQSKYGENVPEGKAWVG